MTAFKDLPIAKRSLKCRLQYAPRCIHCGFYMEYMIDEDWDDNELLEIYCSECRKAVKIVSHKQDIQFTTS